MGRIIAQLKVINPLDKTKQIKCSATVDTGATYLTLPKSWKPQLGQLDDMRMSQAHLADNRIIDAEIWGPIRLEIEGFPATYTEVAFLDVEDDAGFEILLGHMPLQQANMGVDMVNHRLFALKYVDV